MKLLIITLSLIITILSGAYACDISFATDKPEYAVGETAIVTLTLNQTHKNCTSEGKEPVIKASGCELSAKTKFKQKSPGVWEIKYKIKITSTTAAVSAHVDCSNEGGSGALKFKTK
jgi:hypothetical protein